MKPELHPQRSMPEADGYIDDLVRYIRAPVKSEDATKCAEIAIEAVRNQIYAHRRDNDTYDFKFYNTDAEEAADKFAFPEIVSGKMNNDDISWTCKKHDFGSIVFYGTAEPDTSKSRFLVSSYQGKHKTWDICDLFRSTTKIKDGFKTPKEAIEFVNEVILPQMPKREKYDYYSEMN